MADPTLLHTLTLEGFRAYLKPKTFDLSGRPSLAIFAPNGLGKSSVIDALEFLFSENGTLERLGNRTQNNLAGPSALVHNRADEVGVVPMVKFSVINGKTILKGVRAASGNQRTIDATAATVKAGFVVSPIIRGYSLRSFVENHSLENRYSEVAEWLQLTPLVEVQKNLRQLCRDVKADANSTEEQDRITNLLQGETENEVQQWDEEAILDFMNKSILAPLDSVSTLTDVSVEDIGYVELTKHAEAEEKRIGLAGLKQIRRAVIALWNRIESDDDDIAQYAGAVPEFDAALVSLADAKSKETKERDKAAGAVFLSVWKDAEFLFADDTTAPEECPVCATKIDDSAAGSATAIRGLLKRHVSELSCYNNAKTALDVAEQSVNQAHSQLLVLLPAMVDHCSEDDEDDLKTTLIAYQSGITEWPAKEAVASGAIIAGLERYLASLEQKIKSIEEKQGDHTWIKAKAKIDQLIKLKQEMILAIRTKEKLKELHASLVSQATFVSEKIKETVQSLLDTLQAPMNEIYKEIQGANAVPIRLQLPSESDANQQRMQLVIDFAENRTSVAPGGYLSDSQIHSVALALRLAAIKKFNCTTPLIALDDVVTSYDANHRRAIAGLFAKMFTECQIFLVTHDERFFNYLKDQLSANIWQFTRIINIEPGFGPRFADHKVTEEMIADRWAKGESAANEMRQAEEEWLLGIARGFGVRVRIRQLDRAYSYERSELASAIGSFFKGLKMTPANVPGVNDRFIDSLIKGDIENFGSHFQDGPYGDGSIGDEKTRWSEFMSFCEQFQCVCGRTKYKRPFGLNKPVCAHDKCECPFEFKSPTVTAEPVDAVATHDREV